MKSSTEWVCDVCDSQLLPASSSGRFKNNLSRWMRTSEVEGWRSVADLELDTRLGMLWLSHLGNVMGKCKSLANTQLSACTTNDENDFESNLNTMQEKGEAGPKLISLRNMRKAVTTCVAGLKCWFFAQVFWLGHCHIRKCSSHPRTPRCSCESPGFHWVRTNSYNRLQHMNCHSSIAQQGTLIAEQMSSSQRDLSPLHLLIFASFSQAHRTENLRCGHTNICFDIGSLGVKWIEMVWDPAQSRDLEPSEMEVAREMQSLPSTQFTKAPCRHATSACKKCSSHPHAPRCSCISLSPDKQLQPAKTHELSQLNSATRRADRGANVFVTEGSVTLAYFDFCMFFTSPQWFRCEMDWNGLRPCSESRFGTKRKRNCKGKKAKPSNYTICKAWQTRNFLLAKHNDENDFDSNPNLQVRKKNDAGPPWVRERQWPEYRTQKLDLFAVLHRAVETIWQSVRLYRL